MRLEAKILTVSNSVHAGTAEDRTGRVLSQSLASSGFEVVDRRVSPDGVDAVAIALREMSSEFAGLLVTTGGTGFSPTDVTPEATASVVERLAPGLSEAMRLVNPLGRLSRGIAGILGTCLVVNTPGSASGAVECLEAILDVVPHALELLNGENPHPHGGAQS